MLETLINFLYPNKSSCPLCGNAKGSQLICGRCEEVLAEGASLPRCALCGRFITSGGHICSECRGDGVPFSAARAIGAYQGLLKEALYKFKYSGRRSLAKVLGALMAEVLLKDKVYYHLLNNPKETVIIPVPLAREREEQRGFNQSFLLAGEVGRILKLPLCDKLLIKTRNTPSQAKLIKAGRKSNLEGAFSVTNSNALWGKRILLVDDIFTTGATIKECAKVLSEGGTEEIYAITVATGVL